jgi:hypothetical protein
MNVALLKEVSKTIVEHPQEFNMQRWICNTQACIGGWAVCLTRGKKPRELADLFKPGLHPGSCYSEARNVLDLDFYDAGQLFYFENWPMHYRTRYYQATTKLEMAIVTRNRINYFIKNGK